MHGNISTAPTIKQPSSRHLTKLGTVLGVPVLYVGLGDCSEQSYLAELMDVAAERQAVTEALRQLPIHDAFARYEIEYSTARELSSLTRRGVKEFEEGTTHYWYHTPLLCPKILATVFGYRPRNAYKTWKVAEMGFGNGALIYQMLAHLNTKATREDIKCGVARVYAFETSQKAFNRLDDWGDWDGGRIWKGHGRVQDHAMANRTIKVDTAFLSYFVDRDDDQRATFKASVGILKPKGRLVLEGLFPCVLTDSNGVSYGKANVTRGEDAVKDIQLVVAEFKRLGMTLHQVMVGTRLVYSLDGPEVLPTYILVFEKV